MEFNVGQVIIYIVVPLLAYAFKREVQRAEEKAGEAKAIAIDAMAENAALRLHVAENYTSLKRFEGFESALFKKLDTIEGKLDGKADKTGGHD